MSAGYLINNDEPTVVILTDEGLKALLKEYHCKSKEDLDDLLWYDYGVTLIDNRKQQQYGTGLHHSGIHQR